MKLYKVGEKSRAICPFCKQIRSTTFRERDVPLRARKGKVVRDVLAAVCDHCGKVVGIPQQSVPRVAETVRGSRHPLEARIPRQLSDVMGLVCSELSAPDTEPTLFRYYVHRVANHERLRSGLAALVKRPEAGGRASARLSVQLSDETDARFRELTRVSHLTRTNVVKGVIMQMKRDVLDVKDARVLRELTGVLRAVAG